MSDTVLGNEILTREELDDLLASPLQDARAREEDRLSQRLPRSRRPAPAAPRRDADLRRAVAESAGLWGRRMASSYQRRIECSLIGWEESETTELLPALLEMDEVTCFSVASETGFVLMARPLFFALLSLEFGAGGVTRPAIASNRPYTGIERRLLVRLVRQLLAFLEEGWRRSLELRAEVGGTVGRDQLLERVAPRLLLASLDVTALEVVGRVRVGLPAGPFRGLSAAPLALPAGQGTGLERSVAQLPVILRAELGSTELTLAQLASLRVGDTLPFQPSAPDGLLLRVEGQPKFRAIAGRVGSRLASQVVERL